MGAPWGGTEDLHRPAASLRYNFRETCPLNKYKVDPPCTELHAAVDKLWWLQGTSFNSLSACNDLSLAARSLHMLSPLPGTPHGLPAYLPPLQIPGTLLVGIYPGNLLYPLPPNSGAVPTTPCDRHIKCSPPPSSKSDFPHQFSPAPSSGHSRCSVFTC